MAEVSKEVRADRLEAVGFGRLERELEAYGRKVGRYRRPAASRFLHPLPLHRQTHLRVGMALDELRLEHSGVRLSCTLSQLGIRDRTLVAFGGHLPDGQLAAGAPLVCDAVSQRWHPLPPRPGEEEHSALALIRGVGAVHL